LKISFSILVTRYLCAVILHLAIEGEVEQAINMMKFTLYRTGSWNRRIPMFLVAVMQLLGAICTETVNMILICMFPSNTDIIQNLLAFNIIAEIDDYYAASLKNSFPRALQQKGSLSFSKLGKDDHDPLEINKSWVSKGLQWVYRTCQMCYDSFYFYFMPFLVLYLTFVL
jgi:hypothetical protein